MFGSCIGQGAGHPQALAGGDPERSECTGRGQTLQGVYRQAAAVGEVGGIGEPSSDLAGYQDPARLGLSQVADVSQTEPDRDRFPDGVSDRAPPATPTHAVVLRDVVLVARVGFDHALLQGAVHVRV